MLKSSLNVLNDTDLFAMFEHINQSDVSLQVVQTYAELMSHLYWKEKNLSLSCKVAMAGIQYGLSLATVSSNPDEAYKIKSVAKRMAYDLASFTWPGWNEADIVITSADLEVGLEAAQANLRWAKSLNKGPLPVSRAYWMLGAHYLAVKHYDQAADCFKQAEQSAVVAEKLDDQVLAQGYLVLTMVLATPEYPASTQFDEIKQQLAEFEQGEFYISQLETAFKVFSSQ